MISLAKERGGRNAEFVYLFLCWSRTKAAYTLVFTALSTTPRSGDL